MKVFIVLCTSIYEDNEFNGECPVVCTCSSLDKAQEIEDKLNLEDKYNLYWTIEDEVDSYGN